MLALDQQMTISVRNIFTMFLTEIFVLGLKFWFVSGKFQSEIFIVWWKSRGAQGASPTVMYRYF